MLTTVKDYNLKKLLKYTTKKTKSGASALEPSKIGLENGVKGMDLLFPKVERPLVLGAY